MSIFRLTIYLPKTLSELLGSMGSNCYNYDKGRYLLNKL